MANRNLKSVLGFSWVSAVFTLRSEANRTYLGYIWWLMEPGLQVLVYYIIFSVLLTRPDFLGRGGDGVLPFLICGVLPWSWFSRAVSNSSGSIVQSKGIIQQVDIPKIVFPTSYLMQVTFKAFLVFILLLVFLMLIGVNFTVLWFLSPFVFLLQVFFSIGCAYWAAALLPYLPDLKYLIGVGLQLLMFASGIFYDPIKIAPQLQEWFYLNPIACIIEFYRALLIYGELNSGHLYMLFNVLLIASILFVSSLWFLFTKDKQYPRLVIS